MARRASGGTASYRALPPGRREVRLCTRRTPPIVYCGTLLWSVAECARVQPSVQRSRPWPLQPGTPAGRPTHGSDLPFLFDYGLQTAAEGNVRDSIHGFLVNQAVSGDVNSGPRGPGPVVWPAFSTSAANTVLVVNELAEYTEVTSWQEDFCASWLVAVP